MKATSNDNYVYKYLTIKQVKYRICATGRRTDRASWEGATAGAQDAGLEAMGTARAGGS